MRKNLRPKTSFSMNCRLSAADNKVGLSRTLGREYRLKETLASCLTEILIFRINFLNDIFYYILLRNPRGIIIFFYNICTIKNFLRKIKNIHLWK